MKNFSKIALLLLLVIASIFVMASCDKDEVANGEIVVKADAMPQLVYVLGNDLDLSNGVLQVTTEEGTQEVALNAEGVTITGYDKNALGEQTLTITYQGCTTQLTVTVVERMVAEDAVTEYLVGDSLDISKGRVKITRDDATSYTMIFNSDKVTITGFDGSKAGQQTLTATYKNGDITYTCQFPVTVYAVDTVEFKEPTKKAYNSHDPEMNLAGGSLTLKGKNGTLVREIPLTSEMVTVTGFDVSAVTEENSPFTQTLTVTYKETTETFDIRLTYTDVSLFKKYAASFADLDWNTTVMPTISEELGERALDLIALYMDFSPAEQAYITEEERLSVTRAAFTYGMDSIEQPLNDMANAFVIEGGELYLTCESYQALENAIAILGNKDHDLYRISPILAAISTAYADDVLWEPAEGVTYCFGDFGVAGADIYEAMLAMFRHMLDFSDALNAIPENWQEQGVATYADEIKNLYGVIFGNNYYSSGWADIYTYVSEWRTNNDAFDLLYQYYYSQENNTDALNMLAGVAFPKPLDEIMNSIGIVIGQIDAINNYETSDATQLLYQYTKAVNLADAVKNGNDAMAKDLYKTLSVNAYMGLDQSIPFSIDDMLDYIRTTEGGFYHFSGGLLGIDAYHQLMDLYLDVVDKILNDDEEGTYFNSAAHGQNIENMFAAYVALTPTQQFNFLSTVNALYGMGIPPLAFDDSGDYAEFTGIFVGLLNDYYRSKFTSDAASIYDDLVIAMELYALRSTSETGLADFNARMESVATKQALLEGEDEVAFETYLRTAYDKYAAIAAMHAAESLPTDFGAYLGDWEAEFLALQDALVDVEVAYYYTSEGYPMYGMFLSAFERAASIYNYIEKNAGENIVQALYHYDMYGLLGDEVTGDAEEFYPTFEYTFNTYRTVYINYLLTAMGGSIYDAYVGSNLKIFIEKSYDISWTYVWSDDDSTTQDFDKTAVLAAINAFRSMTVDEQVMFINLDTVSTSEGDFSYYYMALDAFLTEQYTEVAGNAARKLLELEQYYMLYHYYEVNGATEEEMAIVLEYIDTVLNSDTDEDKGMIAQYTALAGEDKTSFADFEEMYTYYVELCEALLAASETPAA